MGQTQYSVLMCVYHKDDPEWLRIAMRSMLNQTLRPAEFVLVKDGPLTPELDKVIKEEKSGTDIPFHVVALEKNCGLGEASRIGVEACSTEWIAKMDADDYSAPTRCEKEAEAAEREHADIVGCDANEFIRTTDHVTAQRVFPQNHEDLVRFSRRRTPFCHPAVFMRKSMVMKAGNYRQVYLMEDYDLFIRMLQTGSRGCTVKEPLVFVRINEAFYKRRGGKKYLHTLLAFNRSQRKSGWMGFSDFLVRSCGNLLFCIVPGGVRTLLYKKCLRK